MSFKIQFTVFTVLTALLVSCMPSSDVEITTNDPIQDSEKTNNSNKAPVGSSNPINSTISNEAPEPATSPEIPNSQPTTDFQLDAPNTTDTESISSTPTQETQQSNSEMSDNKNLQLISTVSEHSPDGIEELPLEQSNPKSPILNDSLEPVATNNTASDIAQETSSESLSSSANQEIPIFDSTLGICTNAQVSLSECSNQSGSKFENSSFENINLLGSDFSRAKIKDSTITGTNFSNGEFQNTEFINTSISKSTFMYANLDQASFTNVTITDLETYENLIINGAELDSSNHLPSLLELTDEDASTSTLVTSSTEYVRSEIANFTSLLRGNRTNARQSNALLKQNKIIAKQCQLADLTLKKKTDEAKRKDQNEYARHLQIYEAINQKRKQIVEEDDENRADQLRKEFEDLTNEKKLLAANREQTKEQQKHIETSEVRYCEQTIPAVKTNIGKLQKMIQSKLTENISIWSLINSRIKAPSIQSNRRIASEDEQKSRKSVVDSKDDSKDENHKSKETEKLKKNK